MDVIKTFTFRMALVCIVAVACLWATLREMWRALNGKYDEAFNM